MSYHTNPVATNLPRLGRRSIGAFGAVPHMIEIPRSSRITVARRSVPNNALAQKYFADCSADPNTTDMGVYDCAKEAAKLAALNPDAASFAQTCLASRTSDVPVRTQYTACYGQAGQIPASPGGSPVPVTATAPVAAAGMTTGKWLAIGGVAAVAVYFLVGRKKGS